MSFMIYGRGEDSRRLRIEIFKVLFRIAANEGNERYTLREAFDQSETPNDLRSTVAQVIGSERLADLSRSINYGLVSIMDKGRVFIKEMQEELYQSDNLIFNPMIETTLEETYEIIFQKHKENGQVRWHSHALEPNTPKNWLEAKLNMIKEDVLYEPGIKNTTMLNPKIRQCESYAEASALIESKRNPPPTSININTKSGKVNYQSPHLFNSLNNTKKANTPDKIANTWLITIVGGIIVGLIVWYLTVKVWG